MEKRGSNNNYSINQKISLKFGNIFWFIVDRLASKVKFIADYYEKTIGKSYKDEIKKFNLSNSKNILHVGCGSYPITAIILSEANGSKVTTIDKDYNSLCHARRVVSKKGLDNKIIIDKGNAVNYPLDEYDTIIISGCSFPKKEVLTHVFKNSNPKSKIIVREAFLDIQKIIEELNLEDSVSIENRFWTYPLPRTSWECISLIKK